MGLPVPDRNTKEAREEIAIYFGLIVGVIVRMEQCSLIRYCDREFVVNTDDLQGPEVLTLAAA